MKTILVDAVHCIVDKEGIYFKEIQELLDTYPNEKVILTGANPEQQKKFNLDKAPYKVFTLNHEPEKTDPEYYKVFLEEYKLSVDEVIYFEHAEAAVKSAEAVGIKTYFYDNDKKDLVALKKFMDENL